MKTLITVLILFSMPICGFSQWTGVFFHGDQENVIEVVNKDFVVVVTQWDGRIHRSMDGGQSWSFYQTIFTSSWFLDVHFPTDSIGYACGGTAFGNHTNVITKTIDAGQTWDSISSNDFSGYSFTKIHFLNADTGFVAQESGDILRTFDGANSFSLIPTQGAVTAIESKPNKELFIALRKYISANSYIFSISKSSDFGNSWSSVYADTMNNVSGTAHREISKLFFADNNTGYAVGGNGLFLKTTDGGVTWLRSFLNPYTNLTGLHFTTPNVGYINNAGGIYRTEDGGMNWTVQQINPLSVIHQIEFANDSIGFALGDNGVYRTMNGGILSAIDKINHLADVAIYPNPTKDRLFIDAKDVTILSLNIYNLLGQPIMELENKTELDISSLPLGIYLLHLKTTRGEIIKSFTKE